MLLEIEPFRRITTQPFSPMTNQYRVTKDPKNDNTVIYEMLLPGFKAENISIIVNAESTLKIRATEGDTLYAANKQFAFTLARGEKVISTELVDGILRIITKIEFNETLEENIPIGFKKSQKQTLNG